MTAILKVCGLVAVCCCYAGGGKTA